jgi:hypothetical protein
METIKPETQCECRNLDCPRDDTPAIPKGHGHGYYWECSRDAIRMVTVRVDGLALAGAHYADVPMCAPCADWHESKGA